MSEHFVFLLLTFIFPASTNVARAIHQSQRIHSSNNLTIFHTLPLKKVIAAIKMEKKCALPHEWSIYYLMISQNGCEDPEADSEEGQRRDHLSVLQSTMLLYYCLSNVKIWAKA